jgi:hypothetical protein
VFLLRGIETALNLDLATLSEFSSPGNGIDCRSNGALEVYPHRMAAKTTTGTAQGNPGSGMVWVNLDSGVYHFESSRDYGQTKNGKYMSEADAGKADTALPRTKRNPNKGE